MRSQQDACSFAYCSAGPVVLQSCLQQQEIEKLRYEKQQLSRDNAKLSEASKQHKGQSAALLCQLLKKHSQLVEQQTSSCSSISGLSKALAQQYLHSATLHKALLVQYAQHQQQEVSLTAQLAARDQDISVPQASVCKAEQQHVKQADEMTAMSAEVATSNHKVTNLEAQVVSSNHKVTVLQAQVVTANIKVTELEATCVTAEALRKLLESEVASLRQELATSNIKLAEMKAAEVKGAEMRSAEVEAAELQHKAQAAALEASHKALAEAAAALATSQQEQQAANISMASLRKENAALKESLMQQKQDGHQAMAVLQKQNGELLQEVSRVEACNRQCRSTLQGINKAAFEGQGFIRVNQQLQSEVEQLQCQVGQMYQEMGQMEQQMGKIQLVADYFQQENERLQQEVQQLTAHLQQQQVAGGRGRGKGRSLFDMLQQHKAQSGEVMRLNKELQKHAFTDQALRVLADCCIDSSSIHNTPVAILCQAAAIPNMKLSKLRSLQKSLLLTTPPDKQGDAVMHHQLLEDVMARWMAEPEFDV